MAKRKYGERGDCPGTFLDGALCVYTHVCVYRSRCAQFGCVYVFISDRHYAIDAGVCLSSMGIVDRCAIRNHESSHGRRQSIMIVSDDDPHRAWSLRIMVTDCLLSRDIMITDRRLHRYGHRVHGKERKSSVSFRMVNTRKSNLRTVTYQE